MSLEAIILAAGRGSRLGCFTRDTPKPLLLLEGKPLLVRTIEILRDCHIVDLKIVVGYLKDKVIDCVDKAISGVSVQYIVQEQIGRAEDAVRLGLSSVTTSSVLCLCGDDILQKSHINALVRTLDEGWDGAFLAKHVGRTTLPGVLVNSAGRFVGLGASPGFPIITYNFSIKTGLLERIVANSPEGAPLVSAIGSIAERQRLRVVLDDTLMTINCPEQLGPNGCVLPSTNAR